MREPREFERVPMESVPDPVNRKTTLSSLWPLFDAVVSLPPEEKFAVKTPTKSSYDANMVMNKLKKWAREYQPKKRLVNNRSSDGKQIWIWWVPDAD